MQTMMRLCVVLTEGMSFKLWDEYGLLNREISLYKKLLNYGVQTTFISFGKSEEFKYKELLSEFDIIFNNWNLPNFIYVKLPKIKKNRLN